MMQQPIFLRRRWIWLAVRSSLIVTAVSVPIFFGAGVVVSAWEFLEYSEPRMMQATLSPVLLDTANALSEEDFQIDQLQQVLNADIARLVNFWYGESRAQWLHLNVWSNPAVEVQIFSSEGELLATAGHNAQALDADSPGLIRTGVPLTTLDGTVIGLAKVQIIANYDLTASLMYASQVVREFLYIIIPIALLVALLSTWISIRATRAELQGISSAAGAWAQGDFSARVPVSKAGGLLELGQALNSMAEALAELVSLREKDLVVRERNRLARELHDTVRQQLFGLSLKIGSAQATWRQRGMAEPALEGAQDLIQHAQIELQR